ncbi:hypothetical protein [Christiangramia aquimixticola]|uniref:hypothetical protein n=1 Tax=Christiangramia aquimixticola TaxID=1697558 RepID=UPI003AA948E8
MKRLLSLIFVLLCCNFSQAQSDTYLTFEFMGVDNSQEPFYMETENFWEKIHEQRVASDDIIGWDLWRLLPGGEDQGYQYLTVTIFDSPLKMMRAGDGILESAKMAYPDLSDEEIDNRINLAGSSRNLAVRLFIKVMDRTVGKFEMKPGMILSMDLMKVKEGQQDSYEKAEMESTKSMYQKHVDSGAMGEWQLLKVLLPEGTDSYTSHISVNMFDNWEQHMKSMNFKPGLTAEQQKKMSSGISNRELKWVYKAELVKMVRK